MELFFLAIAFFLFAQIAMLGAAASVCIPFSLIRRAPIDMSVIWRDVRYYWLLRPILYSPIIGVLVWGFERATGGGFFQEGASALPFIVQVVVFYALFELASYWMHRAFHSVSFLQPFHSGHHHVDGAEWTDSRVHHVVFEITFLAMFVLIGLTLSVSPGVFITTIALWAIFLALSHHRVVFSYGPLGYIFLSSEEHEGHHHNKPLSTLQNFGLSLSMYDRIFRTYQDPREHKNESL